MILEEARIGGTRICSAFSVAQCRPLPQPTQAALTGWGGFVLAALVFNFF